MMPTEADLVRLSRRERALLRAMFDLIIAGGSFKLEQAELVEAFRRAVPDCDEAEMVAAVQHAMTAMDCVRAMPSRQRH